MIKAFGIAILCLTISANAMAARGGGGSSRSSGMGSSNNFFVGINGGIVTTEQDDMNLLQSRANVRDGGISAGALKNAYEGSLEIGWRFTGSFVAMALRPSYFYQKSTGTGASGSYEYSLTGFTLFPILRFFPLESDMMRLYMHFGLGYGLANGKIQEGPATVDFSGGSYGSLVGLGTEILFHPNHVLAVEGNVRYLTYTRNIATGSSGTFTYASGGANNSLSQAAKDREVELDQDDLKTSMSGIQFLARYIFYY